MTKALDVAREHAKLKRWDGGFWTYPGCEVDHVLSPQDPTPVPAWHVAVQTIWALIDRGYLEISKENRFGMVEVKPTGLLPS